MATLTATAAATAVVYSGSTRVQWSEINDCGGAPSSSGRGPRHRDLVVSLPPTSSSRGGVPLDPDGNDDKDDDDDDDEDDDNRSPPAAAAARSIGEEEEEEEEEEETEMTTTTISGGGGRRASASGCDGNVGALLGDVDDHDNTDAVAFAGRAETMTTTSTTTRRRSK